MDPTVLRAAFACFPTGVTALAGLVHDKPVGMAVSSFASISLEPPLLAASGGDGGRLPIHLTPAGVPRKRVPAARLNRTARLGLGRREAGAAARHFPVAAPGLAAVATVVLVLLAALGIGSRRRRARLPVGVRTW